jgi:hypothetical protein
MSVCKHCGNDDFEKYYEKARVYGAISCKFREALEEVAKEGSQPAAYIAKKALEWRYSTGSGVPIQAVLAFGKVLDAEKAAEARIVAWLKAKREALREDCPHGSDWANEWAGEIESGEHRT